MITRILLDCDGVLANFHGAACKVHGFDSAKYPVGQWDMPSAMGISSTQFWAEIDWREDFWLALEPYPWLEELVGWLDGLEKERQVRWWVATSPSRDPMCMAHKKRWLRKYVGERKVGQAIMVRDKWLMANAKTLLIDDAEHNCDPFILEGGHAVLWPALWNREYEVLNPLAYVEAQVMDLLTNGAMCDPFGCTAAYYDARARLIARSDIGAEV